MTTPTIAVPVELLERISSVLDRLDALPEPFAEAAELRALLTAQPQASAPACKVCGDFGSECKACGFGAEQGSAAQSAPESAEVLGERCIDGGKCHHQCDKRGDGKCFRRECCTHFGDYSGPWKYEDAAQSAPVENDAFVPGSLADLLFQLGEKGVSVSGGTHGDRWRVRLPQTVAAQSAPMVPGTPGASWRANGEPDPHGDRYNCERAALAMGDLTDDELANGAFMNYDRPLNIEGIQAGTHSSPIAWMTAVKDRIRWLSRKLDEALAAAPAQPAAQDQGEVQRLREALEGVVKRCTPSGYVGMDGQYLKVIRSALAQTSGGNTP